MKIIVGLGNPGEKYVQNRHNVGFMVIDALASQISNIKYQISKWEESKNAKALFCRIRIKGREIEFVKPQAFMNNSGYSVKYAYKKHSVKFDDLYIIHDDLDMPLGSYKIQKGKGPREHGGLLSIYEKLGTKDFWHVRIGVDNRINDKDQRTKGEPDYAKATSGKEYVLQNFTGKEKDVIEKVINDVTRELINKLTN